MLSSPSSSAQAFAEANVGEWAGWQCEFDASTGKVRRVPDHYCSETMVEWDAVPNGFELLSSETLGEAEVSRKFLQLLPEARRQRRRRTTRRVAF